MKAYLVVGLSMFAGLVHADVSGKYLKQNGDVVIRQQGQSIDFTISSVGGSESMPSSCGLEGKAVMLDATRASYTPQDKTDTCSAAFQFDGDRVAVKTNRCDNVCGVRAVGSMEGSYQKKKSAR